ncbi:MAG: glutathione S-transferase family protein [Bradyrhizobiaceae bacterium]|nr:MAG: glutathione S-transferase family protein [Bradyrhizobiaceae bacterium]
MITVWGRANSTNVIKVLWLCEELELEFARRDVGGPFGGLQTPEFLALNPNGSIPVLEDDGAVVWESHSVLRFLAQKYGADSLYPTEPGARSHVERWLDWHISTLAPVLNPVFVALYRTAPEARDHAALKTLIERLIAVMIRLDTHLSAQPFIAGAQFSIADVAFGNSVWRWFAFPFEKPQLPHLEKWQAQVAERPGHRKYVTQPLT